MTKLLIKWVVLGGAMWLAAYLLPGVSVTGGFTTYALIAAVFGLINASLGTVLKFLTFPMTILTLGISLVLINAAMLNLTDMLLDDLVVTGFWWTVGTAIFISITTTVANAVISTDEK